MRSLWIGAVILLGCALMRPVGAVEYAPGPAILLSVQVAKTTVSIGETVRLRFAASDVDYQVGPNNTIVRQINDPVALTWEATGGSFQQRSVGTNPVDLDWQAPVKPGYYAIYVTAKDSGQYGTEAATRRLIEFTVQQMGVTLVPTARLGANPQTVQLDKGTTSVLTAQLLGRDIQGKEVRFYTTRGTLSAATATSDAAGVARVTLTVGKQDIGTAQIAAFAGTTTATTTVEIVPTTPAPVVDPPLPPAPLPPGQNPPGFLVGVNPPTLPADGTSVATVSIRLTDLYGHGLARQPATFMATMGTMGPARVLTNYYGYAEARLIAPTVAGGALIIVEVGTQRGYATITFTPPQQQTAPDGPPRLFLTVDPTVLPADGTSQARVGVLVLDSQGHAAVNTAVTFSATLGTLQPATVNTGPDGRAVATLVAPDRAGVATVSAQVGAVIAANEVTFQGQASGGPRLDLRVWSGQQSEFVAEGWLLRFVQIEGGSESVVTRTLAILDTGGKVTRDIPLGRHGLLIRDQHGSARGYAIEEDGKGKVTLLRPDGTPLRTISVDLQPAGSHLVAAQYAEPAGHLLVSYAQPDGTRPSVQLFAPDGAPLQIWRDGLETMPVMALGGDGYLAVALAGGTLRLYSPAGPLAAEIRRTDGLPATCVAVGPGGQWIAVGAALSGQTATPPRLTVYTRQGTPLATASLDALRLTPIDAGMIVVATADRTTAISLATGKTVWSLPGGYERFLAANDLGLLAGQHDPKTQALLSQAVVVRLADGKLLAVQPFSELGGIAAVLPPDTKGYVGIVSKTFIVRFPFPAEK